MIITNKDRRSLKTRLKSVDKKEMRSFLRNISLILFLSALLFPFNNCGYTHKSTLSNTSLKLSQNNLNVVIDGTPEMAITKDDSVLEITGHCELGGYNRGDVSWLITSESDDAISDSYIAGGLKYVGQCQEGRYQLKVPLPCPGLKSDGQHCFGITQNLKLTTRLIPIGEQGQQLVSLQKTSAPIRLVSAPKKN